MFEREKEKMADGCVAERKMDETATWAVATICFVIIFLSLLWEKVLHRVEKVKFNAQIQNPDLNSFS